MSSITLLKLTRVITLEEHFFSSAYLDASKDNENPKYKAFGNIAELGSPRLKDMDEASVSVQVISLAPGPAKLFTPDMCSKSNDQLRQAVIRSPSRIAGFAALPMDHVEEAVLELERAVTDLKFKGALINNHLDGQFFDEERFWPIFAKAESLDVPIYIHPSPPSEQMMQMLYSSKSFSQETAFALGTAGWGWHELTGLHVVRLMLAGLFDKFPNLQIIIGHNGEGIPCMLERLEQRMQPQMVREGRKRDISTIMKNNISITIAGFFSIPVLKLLLALWPIERLMYSVDYPFVSLSQGTAYLSEIMSSGIMSQDDFDLFTHKNATRLLKL